MKTIRLFLVAALMGLSGCMLMSQYDPQTDQEVTSVHKELIGHVLIAPAEKNPPGITEDEKKFYRNVRIDLDSLKLRASSIPKNNLTVEQIEILRGEVDSLEKLDQLGFNYTDAQLIQKSIDRTCQAILTLELAKKR